MRLTSTPYYTSVEGGPLVYAGSYCVEVYLYIPDSGSSGSGGGGGSASPTPASSPCWSVASGGTVAGLVSNDSALKALVAQIANVVQVPINYVTTPIIDPVTGQLASAQAHVDYNLLSNDYINWNDAQVTQSVQLGQDATQIAYHEYDHIFNSIADPSGSYNHRVPLPGDVSFPANGMATVNIGGSVFSYNLNDPVQFQAYSHAVIHNDLVNAYGSDKTGALAEAVQGIARSDPTTGAAQPELPMGNSSPIQGIIGRRRLFCPYLQITMTTPQSEIARQRVQLALPGKSWQQGI